MGLVFSYLFKFHHPSRGILHNLRIDPPEFSGHPGDSLTQQFATEKRPLEKGKSYWKPPFLGAFAVSFMGKKKHLEPPQMGWCVTFSYQYTIM